MCLAEITVGSNCDKFHGSTKLSWNPEEKARVPLFDVATGIEIPRVNCRVNLYSRIISSSKKQLRRKKQFFDFCFNNLRVRKQNLEKKRKGKKETKRSL